MGVVRRVGVTWARPPLMIFEFVRMISETGGGGRGVQYGVAGGDGRAGGAGTRGRAGLARRRGGRGRRWGVGGVPPRAARVLARPGGRAVRARRRGAVRGRAGQDLGGVGVGAGAPAWARGVV